MRSAALARSSTERYSLGPWLWSPSLDLATFGGSAVLALSLVLLGRVTGMSDGAMPEWGFIVFVLAIDVAHVYSTLFRSYFDGQELESRGSRYWLLPACVYIAGVGLHLYGARAFWGVLAYLALFHFVRQQVGWVAVYRARAGQHARFDALLDAAVVYAATLYPVLHWHSRLSATEFEWFVEGDFVDVSAFATAVLPYARLLWLILLLGFALRQVGLLLQTNTFHLGKTIVVASTAATWYVGIVATNSDFDFTVTNVIVHGVPYMVLLWVYARERKNDAPDTLGSRLCAGGIGAFVGVLLVLAFAEELVWHRLVWNDQHWLFGGRDLELGPLALAIIVPLLAMPQAVHYVLDGLLWRRTETRRIGAQRRALGFV